MTTSEPKLLCFIKKSMKKPVKGDVFVMRRKDNRKYLYGLVVEDRASIGVDNNLLLIYIYNYQRKETRPVPELKKEDLLIAPLIQGYQGWMCGYYFNVDSVEINPDMMLAEHKFWSPRKKDSAGNGIYYNEHAEEVGVGMRGDYALFGMGTHYIVDLRLRKALGLAPIDALE